MPENKTRPTKLSVAAFIDAIDDDTRRADAKALVTLMQEVTGERATLWGSAIVGFGSHHYRYGSSREGDMPLVSFSPRKSATVVYINGGFKSLSAHLAKLGPHKTSGVCLHLKRVSDVDKGVLAKLVTASVDAIRSPKPTSRA
jgi:Domain of unknown function (DU1801)